VAKKFFFGLLLQELCLAIEHRAVPLEHSLEIALSGLEVKWRH